jgi:diguanylate cyclase (GGDEF)-like protein
MPDFNSSDKRQEAVQQHTPVILVVDDDPALRLVLRHCMEQEGYHVIEANNGLEAIQATVRQQPDLILMDAVMPEMDGFRATSELKAMPEYENIPILIITSLDDDHSVSQAFASGACDYVTKPVNWSVLKHRVRRLLHTAEAERKLEHLSYHDTLTGLPNRLLFMDRMDQSISRAMRTGEKFTLLFIDIDHFKVINDSMGHEAGDKLLTTVTSRLQQTLRRSDTIARLGGDEFTIILENISDPEDIIYVANNLLETLAEPISILERKVCIGASIGVAVYPDDGESFGALLKNSDTAMYRAKEKGRNTFEFYTSEMSTQAMKRLELEDSLRNAINNEEFVVYYQPKFDLKTRKLVGMEALVRWDHPESGIIPPDEFIPLAEETGLITSLGKWVIESSCEQLHEWQQKGYHIPNLSINVSARQFHEQNLGNIFRRVMEQYNLAPEHIEIELTENILVQDHEKARRILDELHSMGIHIALDDFGTGYASMAYLKDFPINTVKIDRSFISNIPGDKENMAIVRAISGLTQSLDLCLIAEGVETDQQIEFLKDINCEQGQGFYWSRPLSPDIFEVEFLRKG